MTAQTGFFAASDPYANRVHRRRMERMQQGMTPEQIMQAKNQRCKERGQARKEQRVKDAAERSKAWRSLKPAQQLKELDNRLGVGMGASKQRAKIAKLLKK